MRIVQFVGQYPDDISLFRRTKDFDGTLIGEYYGDDLSIEDYDLSLGPWPIRDDMIAIDTKIWLRDHLGEQQEFDIRLTASTDPTINSFMQMIDARVDGDLIVSDPLYKTGLLLIETAGAITAEKTDYLLALGGHTR